jgi:hypothetical protein
MYRIGVSALIVNTSDEMLLVNLESFEEKVFCHSRWRARAGGDARRCGIS